MFYKWLSSSIGLITGKDYYSQFFFYALSLCSVFLSLQVNWILHHDDAPIFLRLFGSIFISVVIAFVSFPPLILRIDRHINEDATNATIKLSTRASLLHLFWVIPFVQEDWVKNLIGPVLILTFLLSVGLSRRPIYSLSAARLNLLLVLLFALAFFFGGEFYSSVARVVLREFFTLAVLILPGFYLARIYLREWISVSLAFAVSIPLTITIYSVCLMGLNYLEVSVFDRSVALWLLVCLPILMGAKKRLLTEVLQVDREVRNGLVITFLASTIAICFMGVGQTSLEFGFDWTYPASRGSHSLPVDNFLPYDTAKTAFTNGAPWSWGVGQWDMLHRTPLMGLVLAILNTLTNVEFMSFDVYFQYAVLLNALFLLPLISIAHHQFRSERVAKLATISVFFGVFFFINIFFTWPKLFAVYFLLVGIQIYFKSTPSINRAVLMGGCCSLGYLSHAGVLLSLPVLGIAWMMTRVSKFSQYYHGLVFLGVFSLGAMAWATYTNTHPVEGHDSNLLYYHFVPTEYQQSNLLLSYINYFEQVPVDRQFGERVDRVVDLLNKHAFSFAIEAIKTGSWQLWRNDSHVRREFFFPSSAIGEVTIIFGLVALLFHWISPFVKSKIIFPSSLKQSTGLLVVLFLSHQFQAFVKVAELTNHSLGYIEPILATLILTGLVYSLNKVFRILLFS